MLSPLMRSCEVAHAAVSRNGKRIGTAQLDGQIRVWRLPRPHDDIQSLSLGLPGRWDAQASPQSHQLLLTPGTAEGAPQHVLLLHGDASHYKRLQLTLPGEFVASAWTPQGDRLAILTGRRSDDPPATAGQLEPRGTATLSDPPQLIELPFLPSKLAPNPNGTCFVISDSLGGLWQVDLNGSRQLTSWIPRAHDTKGQDQALVFSSSGNCLVRCRAQGQIEVWDAESHHLRFSSDAPSPSRRRITPSPKGPHLLITDSDGTSQVIHLESGRFLGKLLRYQGGIVAQGFSPDGRWVVTSGHDGCLLIRDWRTGEMVCPPLVHEDEVFGFDFSANGDWLAAACRDGTFHVWDTRIGASLLPVESVNEPLFDVRLSADNGWAVLMGNGSTVWVRNLHILQEATNWSVEELTALSEVTSGLAVDRDLPVILSSADWQTRMTRILTLRPEYFQP